MNGFDEIRIGKRGKGDHCGLLNKKTVAYTEVDTGKGSFSAREMLAFVKQSGIHVKNWLQW